MLVTALIGKGAAKKGDGPTTQPNRFPLAPTLDRLLRLVLGAFVGIALIFFLFINDPKPYYNFSSLFLYVIFLCGRVTLSSFTSSRHPPVFCFLSLFSLASLASLFSLFFFLLFYYLCQLSEKIPKRSTGQFACSTSDIDVSSTIIAFIISCCRWCTSS